MCGIFGAVFVAPGESIDVDRAVRSMAHRGPDAQGTHRLQDACFGHTRLRIVDLSDAAAQPMRSTDEKIVLVFNGEIYNHHELRAELRALGHTFRSRSDTEVILEGYRAWQTDIVEKLDGMFALGLWDAERRRLLLARDRAGKKPLFYSAPSGRAFRFASEIKALTASGVPAVADHQALPQLLSFGYTPAPETMFKGVRQLPPASTLILQEGKPPEIRRFWKAPFAEAPIDCSVAEAKSEVRRLLEAAVKRRLEADVPLGAFLSGGIDSTIIVGIMARQMSRPVKTFSIGFSGDARYDETHYARIAARAFGTDHTEFTLEPSSFDLVERLVELHDGPFGDSSAIPTSVVAALTKKHVTVALTGDGGDELFCGYIRFLAAEAAERVPLVLRRVGGRVAALLPPASSERQLRAKARRFLLAAALPLSERVAQWSSLFAFDLEQLVRKDVQSTLPMEAPLAWSRAIFAASEGASTLSRVLDHNFETYLPYDLLVKADRSSMAHGLEARSPFLDTALVEYVARLPDQMKRRGVTTKWILKSAFADLLPKELVSRRKMGFGVPLGAWFRGELREYLRDHLSPSAKMYDLIDRSFVEAMLKQHLDGVCDHGHRLWLLLTLEVWLRSLSARQKKTEPLPYAM